MYGPRRDCSWYIDLIASSLSCEGLSICCLCRWSLTEEATSSFLANRPCLAPFPAAVSLCGDGCDPLESCDCVASHGLLFVLRTDACLTSSSAAVSPRLNCCCCVPVTRVGNASWAAVVFFANRARLARSSAGDKLRRPDTCCPEA